MFWSTGPSHIGAHPQPGTYLVRSGSRQGILYGGGRPSGWRDSSASRVISREVNFPLVGRLCKSGIHARLAVIADGGDTASIVACLAGVWKVNDRVRESELGLCSAQRRPFHAAQGRAPHVDVTRPSYTFSGAFAPTLTELASRRIEPILTWPKRMKIAISPITMLNATITACAPIENAST